jgi:hypothetical protein
MKCVSGNLLAPSATWAKPPSTTAARPLIVITVLNSQYLHDNEDGIYARAPTASSQLQEVVADLIRQGVVTPGSEGWRANIPGPPALGLVPGKSYD